MRNFRLILALLMVLTLAAAVFPIRAQDTPPWPTTGWPTSTPEEQGVDSAQLVEMLDFMEDLSYPIHSLLIIRNGHLIMEAYRYPYDADTLHAIMSCTKSFTSALIGIALEQGYITDVNRPVIEFFPDRQIANLDEAKQGMTLEHLLTMSGGFDWPGGMTEQPTLSEWTQSPDWVQFVLDRPLSDPPGTRFVYNTGGSHLLSAILQSTVGMTAEAFATTNLFTPLGITDWYWSTDPQGINGGGGGLWLRPQDMAKFGYLYLNGGQWDGQQVVPADWVAESWRRQITAGGNWLADGYGYQWWVDGSGYFMALGYGGQYIVVVPDRNLIMVATSGLRLQDFFVPETLLTRYILPASESADPLPANPEGVAALNARIAALANPDQAQTVPPLPETALQVSGRTYALEPSGVGWLTLGLNFTAGEDSAALVVDGWSLAVGLDSVFRATDPEWPRQAPRSARWLLRGSWTDANTFVIRILIVGRPEQYTETLRFEGDTLTVREQEYVTGEVYMTTGRTVE
jgi:CubicO group peptidase (beta-lactamase class C family)